MCNDVRPTSRHRNDSARHPSGRHPVSGSIRSRRARPPDARRNRRTARALDRDRRAAVTGNKQWGTSIRSAGDTPSLKGEVPSLLAAERQVRTVPVAVAVTAADSHQAG